MQNAGLDETQGGIKILGRSINNLRYADWYHANGRKQEELKNFLIKVKEESKKTGLKLNIQKANIMASSPSTSWPIEGEEKETVTDFILFGLTVTVDGDCSHKIKRHLLIGRKRWQTYKKVETSLC